MADHGNHEAGRRLGGDADMNAAMTFEGLRLVVIERVHLGKVGDRLDQRLHQERHQREPRAIRAVLGVQGGAQLFQRGVSVSVIENAFVLAATR